MFEPRGQETFLRRPLFVLFRSQSKDVALLEVDEVVTDHAKRTINVPEIIKHI
jgi:hypothetical protein